MEYVIDFQAFKQLNNEFIIKELTIQDLNDETSVKTYLFKPPFSWNSLSKEMKVQNKWLERHYHCLNWFSGELDYGESIKIIKSLNVAKMVYVKGDDKNKWLEKYLNNVYNIEEFNCPAFKIIKNSFKNDSKCNNHIQNVNYKNCSLSNVNVMRSWIIMMMK